MPRRARPLVRQRLALRARARSERVTSRRSGCARSLLTESHTCPPRSRARRHSCHDTAERGGVWGYGAHAWAMPSHEPPASKFELPDSSHTGERRTAGSCLFSFLLLLGLFSSSFLVSFSARLPSFSSSPKLGPNRYARGCAPTSRRATSAGWRLAGSNITVVIAQARPAAHRSALAGRRGPSADSTRDHGVLTSQSPSNCATAAPRRDLESSLRRPTRPPSPHTHRPELPTRTPTAPRGSQEASRPSRRSVEAREAGPGPPGVGRPGGEPARSGGRYLRAARAVQSQATQRSATRRERRT